MSESGNLYQRLVDCALTRLGSEGRLPASVVELAECAGVGADDARGIFASPEALHEALIYQAVVLLNDELRQGVIASGSVSPDDQLRSLARSYSRWAEENPGLFRLIADGLAGPLPEESTLYRFSLSMRDLFLRKFNEMRDTGLMRGDADIGPVMLLIHCVMRGVNAIFVNRAHDPWLREEPRPTAAMTIEMFDYLIDGLLVVNAPSCGKIRTTTH